MFFRRCYDVETVIQRRMDGLVSRLPNLVTYINIFFSLSCTPG